MKLTTEELKLLYNYFEHSFIHYEKPELIDLFRKIRLYIEEQEIIENEVRIEVDCDE